MFLVYDVAHYMMTHNRVRERFLEAVERERLTFHVNKHALPSQVRFTNATSHSNTSTLPTHLPYPTNTPKPQKTQVRDPLGFLWWHNARLPLKKQWGRFRAFPQQTAEVLALQGLPDVRYVSCLSSYFHIHII